MHKERPFYSSLCDYMTSGPVVVAVLEGDGRLTLAGLMGATDPAKAAAGTIRKDFGQNVEQNATHGSDAHGDRRKRNRILLQRDGSDGVERRVILRRKKNDSLEGLSPRLMY